MHIYEAHVIQCFMDLHLEDLDFSRADVSNLFGNLHLMSRHLCLYHGEAVSVSYVVEGDALHGLVLLQGVHLVQVAVSDEHSAVLRLVEMVDLGNTKHPHYKLKCTHTHTQKHTHLNYPAGETEQTRSSWVYLFVQTESRRVFMWLALDKCSKESPTFRTLQEKRTRMNLSFRCSSLETSVKDEAVSGLSRFCRPQKETEENC